MSSEVSDGTSSKEESCALENMPLMDFDRYLLTPYEEDVYRLDEKRIEIPIFFGVPMLILREKHEIELKNGKSFIEAEPPAQVLVETLVDRILINCTNADDLYMILSQVKSVVLFYTIVELLARLPVPLILLSAKTAQLASKTLLLPPLQPHDYIISEELYTHVTRHYAEQGDNNVTRFKRNKEKNDTIVHPLVEKYYLCETPAMRRIVKMNNRFNRGFYHDLHTIESTVQRNLARFIMRNIIHLARRYILVNFQQLYRQRQEPWYVTHVTIRPHITEYAYTRLAELIGPLIFRQSGIPEYYPDVEQRAMLNVFASTMDRMWFPGQHISDIVQSMEPTYCHANCVCGRGVSAIPNAVL